MRVLTNQWAAFESHVHPCMTNQWVVFESHEHLCKPRYKSTRVDELLISFIIWQTPQAAKQDEPNPVL